MHGNPVASNRPSIANERHAKVRWVVMLGNRETFSLKLEGETVFGLFSKKKPSYPTESRWDVVQGERSGEPIFVRRNASAQSLARHPEYRFRVGIAIPLNAPSPDGLPTNDEVDELNAIEDRICALLEQGNESLLVLAITTSGMREFVFYTRSPDSIESHLDALRSEVVTHEIQNYVAEDPKWSVYAQFA